MEHLLSTTEVAEWLGVPMETVRRWRKHGDGPRGFKVGRHVRYDPTDVRAWLDAQRAQEDRPTSVPA